MGLIGTISSLTRRRPKVIIDGWLRKEICPEARGCWVCQRETQIFDPDFGDYICSQCSGFAWWALNLARRTDVPRWIKDCLADLSEEYNEQAYPYAYAAMFLHKHRSEFFIPTQYNTPDDALDYIKSVMGDGEDFRGVCEVLADRYLDMYRIL